MLENHSRYLPNNTHELAEGWKLQRLTRPSRLFGANGMQAGPDGRLYVAQVAGSQISALNVDSGNVETVSPLGGDIVAPDDLAFDDRGNLYATEITEGRVSVRSPDGRTRVLRGDLPVSNPITWHQGTLISGECRPEGRIMQLDLSGGEPRVILAGVPAPNAFEVGPDGKLYFPVMGANEIWRIGLEGGQPEVIARNLGIPNSVKFDAKGFIVSTQVATGEVLRIDPRTGDKVVLAQLAPGLDNCAFVDGRLFVSRITGQIDEIVGPGQTRPLVADGLQWPLGLAVDEDGTVFVADGGFAFALRPGEELEMIGNLFSQGFPGYIRGVASLGAGEFLVTTANGEVARYSPSRQESTVLAAGYDRLMDIAVSSSARVVFAELTGSVFALEGGVVIEVARGLDEPKGVAIDSDGTCYVAESGAGRVVRLGGVEPQTVVDGLCRPEGIAVRNGRLYVLDVAAQELVVCDLATGTRVTVASRLPVGAPPGVTPKLLGPIGMMCGPMGNFTGLAVGHDGTVYVAADAEGSVLSLHTA